LTAIVAKLSTRFLDNSEFNKYRLQSIENRLAQLDGGLNADDAILRAFERINEERRGTGKAPLGFKLK
jgi:hypothetical protein